VTVALQSTALCALADLKVELGISGSTYDDLLNRRINAASDAIAAYCNRKRYGFAFGAVAERVAVGPNQSPRLRVSLTPIIGDWNRIELHAVPGPSEIVDTDEYALEDAERGYFYNDARWPFTGLRQVGVVQDYEARTEKATILVSYVGGYVTQPQIDTAATTHWPGATTSTTLGALITPSGHATQYWAATGLDDSVESGIIGTTGNTEPTWGNTPSVGDTKTDGTLVWTYLGTAAQAKSIPAALEQAALDVAVMLYRRQGQNTEIQSESLGRASVTYGKRGALPESVMAVLDNGYVRGGLLA